MNGLSIEALEDFTNNQELRLGIEGKGDQKTIITYQSNYLIDIVL